VPKTKKSFWDLVDYGYETHYDPIPKAIKSSLPENAVVLQTVVDSYNGCVKVYYSK